MIANGLHQNLESDDYFRDPRVNWSTLKHMSKAPLFYRHALLSKFEDTDALKLGRAYHIATLEPERYLSRCVAWEGRRSGKEWEAFKEKFKALEILTEREHSLCLEIAKAVRADPRAQPYLNKGQREVTMAWTHKSPTVAGLPGYEFRCKGRLDFDSATALVDLKGTIDASPEGFARESWKYRYETQAAWYSDAYFAITGKRKPYVIVAVEKRAPHAVSVYQLGEDVLQVGREHYRGLLDTLNHCTVNSNWPSYFEGEQPLTIPRWTGLAPEDEDDPTGLGIEFPDVEQGAQ